MAKEENVDKLNTPPANIANQQMKEKLTLKKNDSLKMEHENTTEEEVNKNFSPEERSEIIKMPMKVETKDMISNSFLWEFLSFRFSNIVLV